MSQSENRLVFIYDLFILWYYYIIFFLSSNYIRTDEDVRKVIEHAKLSIDTLKPIFQPIYFGEQFESYKLLELDENVLSDLKCGSTYVRILIKI